MKPDPETLAELLGGLESRGRKPAIMQVHEDGTRLLPYSALADDIARCAGGLRSAGLNAGATVALLAAGGPDWITAFLSLIAAHAIPIPLDTQTDEDTLRHILTDSAASWAITDAARSRTLTDAGFKGREIRLDNSATDALDWQSIKQGLPDVAPANFSADDPAVLFYTSGTTGPPKGVPLTQRNVSFQLRAIVEAGLVNADDIVLQPLPLHHVYPLIVGTLAPLALGLTIVMPEAMLGPQVVAALREGNVSFIVGVPRLYEALVASIESRISAQAGLAGALLRLSFSLCLKARRRLGWRLGKVLLFPLHRALAPSLRVLASGGAALDPGLALKIEALGWQVTSGYGLTETSPLLTINPPGNGRLASVGRAVPGIEIRIDTSAPGTTDDDGAAREGEILARGDGVFEGYLNHRQDRDSFTPDGWFRTADLGYIHADGHVYITGRRNTLLVTSSGKNIQPDELESRYAEHELIDEIGLLMDGQQLAAVVVPAMEVVNARNMSAENAARLALTQQGRQMASYRRIGRHVISRDPLPRTRLGKIQRHKLAELYGALRADPAYSEPRGAPARREDLDDADRKRLEDPRVAGVWELLARRYREHGLTLDSNLQVDLGIDSLGWLELGTEIGQKLGVSLDEKQIADIQTVRDLLDVIAITSASAAKASPVDQPDAHLSESQRRYLTPLSPLARRTASFLYAIHRLIIRTAFRLRVEGLENLPRDRQWIVAPNHASFLDPSVIASALPKQTLASTYWAGWTGYAFRNAIFRGISRLAQVIPIDAEHAATSSLAFAAAVLDRGKNLVLFPEGERSATGELLELKRGIGLLAARFRNAAIVPVRITGSLDAWPRDRSWPRLRPISVTFGPPLDPSSIVAGNGADEAGAIIAELRAALENLRR
jgi:long-chain acyl-CoA synthetase